MNWCCASTHGWRGISRLATAPDARFDDPEMTVFIGLSAVTGPVKAVLDGQMPARGELFVENELIELLSAYLQTYKLPR